MRDVLENPQIPGRARKVLGAALAPDERPLVVIIGAADQLIVGTSRRAIVYKPGLQAGTPFGHQLSSYEYRNITGVQVHVGALVGVLAILAPGADAVPTSILPNAKSDAHRIKNAIPIGKHPTTNAAITKLRELIAAAQTPTQPTSLPGSPRQPADIFDQLKKLGALRDAGILSQEEFAAKKAELLARI